MTYIKKLKIQILVLIALLLSFQLHAQTHSTFWMVEAHCEFTQAADNEGISGLIAVITKNKIDFEAELVITHFSGVKSKTINEPIPLVYKHSYLGKEVKEFVEDSFLASYTLKNSKIDFSGVKSIDYYNINPLANVDGNEGHELVVFKDKSGLALLKGARLKSYYVNCKK